MGGGLLDGLLDAIRSAGGEAFAVGLGVALALLLLIVAWRILGGRRRVAAPTTPDLSLDVNSLGDHGPPASGPTLEHYHVPVRLAAVILAPAGRDRELPSFDRLPELIDHLVPGLGKVVAAHRPTIRRWPPQLSAEGFAHQFFAQARLPGDGGKGTRWCSVAGRFKVNQETVMAGLILCAEEANNYGQSIVREEHQWLAILGVKAG